MENEILLQIKPTYVSSVRIFANLIVLIFLSAMLLIPLGSLLYHNFHMGLGLISLLSVAFFMFLLSILLYFDRKNYEATTYKIYKDRIEFEEGFINHKCSSIKMVDIKEIHLEQSFFQRQAGLGTIKILTASYEGIYFRDIKNSNAIYANIKQILENNE